MKPKVNDVDTAERWDLIVQLTQLLELDWSLNKQTDVSFIDEDPVKILATKIHAANSVDQSHFVYVS